MINQIEVFKSSNNSYEDYKGKMEKKWKLEQTENKKESIRNKFKHLIITFTANF